MLSLGYRWSYVDLIGRIFSVAIQVKGYISS